MALTVAQVSDAVYNLLTGSPIPSRWYGKILGGDFSFSFYDDLGYFESDQLPNLAGAARLSTRDAFTQRTPFSVAQVAYILGLPAPTLLDNVAGAAVQTGEDIGDGLQKIGNSLIGAGGGFLDNLGTVGKLLPWAIGLLLLRKVKLL